MSSFSPKTSMCLYLWSLSRSVAGLGHLVMIPNVLGVCVITHPSAQSGRNLAPTLPAPSNGRKPHPHSVAPSSTLNSVRKLPPSPPTPNPKPQTSLALPDPLHSLVVTRTSPNANPIGHPVPRSRPSRMHIPLPLSLIHI